MPIGERRAAFGLAEREEMRQRIDLRGRNVGVLAGIVRGVKAGRRIAAFVPARDIIMVERVDMRRRHIAPLILVNERTAIDGLSGRGDARAFWAALIQMLGADSGMLRPFQMVAIKSSLL